MDVSKIITAIAVIVLFCAGIALLLRVLWWSLRQSHMQQMRQSDPERAAFDRARVEALRLNKPDFLAEVNNTIEQYSALDPDSRDYLWDIFRTFESLLASVLDITERDFGELNGWPIRMEPRFKMAKAKECLGLIDDKCAQIVAETLTRRDEVVGGTWAKLQHLGGLGIKLPADAANFHELAQSDDSEHATTMPFLREAKAATETALEFGKALDVLLHKVTHLEAALPGLAKRVQNVEQDEIARLGKILDELALDYAPESWEPVRDSMAQAEKLIRDAKASLLLTNELWAAKDYDLATAEAKATIATLDSIGILLKNAHAQKVSLQQQKQKVEELLPEIDAKLLELTNYVGAHIDLLGESNYRQDMDFAKKCLDKARSELELPLPSYTRAFKLATSANTSADSVLANCKNIVARTHGDRLRATNQLAQAREVIDEVKRYIAEHEAAIAEPIRENIRVAEGELAKAENPEDDKGVSDAIAAAQYVMHLMGRTMTDARYAVKMWAVRDGGCELHSDR